MTGSGETRNASADAWRIRAAYVVSLVVVAATAAALIGPGGTRDLPAGPAPARDAWSWELQSRWSQQENRLWWVALPSAMRRLETEEPVAARALREIVEGLRRPEQDGPSWLPQYVHWLKAMRDDRDGCECVWLAVGFIDNDGPRSEWSGRACVIADAILLEPYPVGRVRFRFP